MERLAQMRIGTRLAVGFGFVLVLLTLTALFAAAQVRTIGTTAQRIVEADYRHIALANQIDRGINAQANSLRSAVLAAADDEAAKAYLSEVSAATREPRCENDSTRLSASRRRSASRTVPRLTSNSSDSRASVRRSPGGNRPRMICLRNCWTMRSASVRSVGGTMAGSVTLSKVRRPTIVRL